MALQCRALYEADENGRLTRANEPAGGDPEAPRLFLGLTLHGSLWRLRSDLPPATARALSRLAGAEPVPTDLDRLPDRLGALRARLEADAPIRRVWHGPAYRFPDELPAFEGVVALTSDADAAGLDAFPGLRGQLAARLPAFAVVRDGQAVSVAYAATTKRAPDGPVEVGVETAPGHRRQGFAARVVSAFANAVRADGGIPLYSTAHDNRASQAVARKLGLVRYGTDLHLR